MLWEWAVKPGRCLIVNEEEVHNCFLTFWLQMYGKLARLTEAYYRPYTDILFLKNEHWVLTYSLLHDSISGVYRWSFSFLRSNSLTAWQLSGVRGCSPGGRKQLPKRKKLSLDHESFYWIIAIKICHRCKESVHATENQSVRQRLKAPYVNQQSSVLKGWLRLWCSFSFLGPWSLFQVTVVRFVSASIRERIKHCKWQFPFTGDLFPRGSLQYHKIHSKILNIMCLILSSFDHTLKWDSDSDSAVIFPYSL